MAFLKQESSIAFPGKSIVITHHVPTLSHYPAQYFNSDINQAFAVELMPLIRSCGADYWIYGHHHVNTPTFLIGQTQLMTNQLGYVHAGEHTLFKRDAFIEV
ncbi:MAG: hypothetical protein ABI581_05655 [Sediminibacterium sp.]